MALLAVAFVVLAIASARYFFYAARGGEAIDSVAVLPFINASGDPNTEYLSEGISDSIINSLSRLPNLKVNSLNSVLPYKGQADRPADGWARAECPGGVDGQNDTARRRLTISAELVDVSDNRRLWGEQYNRKLSDILVVQDEIAREISEGLRLRLTGEEKKQLAKQSHREQRGLSALQFGQILLPPEYKRGI